jgi:threonine synthase
MDILECLFCRKRLPWDVFSPFCPECREPLFFAREPGQRRIHEDRAHPLERWLDFLPLERVDPGLSLGEGNTPLLEMPKLGFEAGVPELYAKFEAQNPTMSFKDRGTAAAIQKAVTLGFKRIGTVSTGNMAASTAAYGARAGLETTVLLKEEASRQSLLTAGVFGPRLVRVKGDYGSLFYRSLEIGRKLGIYFMNSVDPIRVEGYKVTGFEIFRQSGNRAPGYIFVPVSSGGHLIGLMRAFEDLLAEGLVDQYPKFIGIQAEGCAPLARAFAAGRPRFERFEGAHTIAQGISNPAPPAGNAVLHMIREHGGILLAVSDAEILDAQRALAVREGLFCQPESAVTWAGLARLAREDRMAGTGSAVLVLTGSGLKAAQILELQPVRPEDVELPCLEKALRDGAAGHA